MDLFCHADVVGTTLVHIPLVFDSSEHQVGSRRQDGIAAALDALDTHSRRMKALVAVLDEWDHFLTPSECGVGPCGNHSGPTRDRVPSDGAMVVRLVQCLRSGNQQLEQLVDLLATELVHSTTARGC